ncbi:MAG: SsrA-binding protein SmpB [candidate division Zixibacteria bacterium]|nr:SsrA-binding protein SmpB [candidate division Zixibacteria bacterium]
MSDKDDVRYIARNRKARRDYHIRDTIEAGIELRGSEVKSLRSGKATITDAYAVVEDGQVVLKKLHISPYKMAQEPHDPLRPRRLLLHKRQIRKLFSLTEQRGYTLIVLSIYFRNNLVKVELAVAEGRKRHDKRHIIEKADADRRIRQATQKKY